MDNDQARLFPEAAEAAAETGTTYDAEPGTLPPLNQPTDKVDFSDATLLPRKEEGDDPE